MVNCLPFTGSKLPVIGMLPGHVSGKGSDGCGLKSCILVSKELVKILFSVTDCCRSGCVVGILLTIAEAANEAWSGVQYALSPGYAMPIYLFAHGAILCHFLLRPRLKFPSGALSRSSMKLEEALHTAPEDEVG